MTAIYLLVGAYSLTDHSVGWWFVYPTYYHFVASIILLYIPFYVIVKTTWLRTRLPLLMAGLAAIWIAVYLVLYDKSYYHIDTVREPMIRFLFMESMLLGAWFRQNDERMRSDFRWLWPVGAAVCFAAYFASKLLFSRRAAFAPFQIINQMVIFTLLYFLMRTFAGLDAGLLRMPAWCKRVIGFIAEITLEIYVVQYVLIWTIRPLGHFPLNWLALTAAIILCAWLLHVVCSQLYRLCDRAVTAIRGRK